MLETHAPVEARLEHLALDMRDKANAESEPVGGLREYVRDHASSLEDFARQVRNEYTRVKSLPTDSLVRITEQARDAYNEARAMCDDARAWAMSGIDIDIDRPDAEEIARERLRAAEAMELSLLRGLAHLMFVSQSHDGPLELWKDMQGSFFWKHERSGYHGGLIFHANARLSNERAVVGTWGLHT